jgi:hypothetical protein
MSLIPTTQLGFDALLQSADHANLTRQMERECAHLPGSLDAAIPFYRVLIERHHAAMLAGDATATNLLREEADRLAIKLNNFEPGIIAGPDASGNILACKTRAPVETVPLWGQTGGFEISCAGMSIHIEMEGILGVASDVYQWLGFSAHALEFDKPFISETGFRSFIAIGGALEPGYTPDRFAAEVISAHVKHQLRGKLLAIGAEYRPIESGAVP